MVPAASALILGILLIAAGVGLWVCLDSPGWRAWFALPTTARNWGRLLSPRAGQVVVVEADELVTTLSLPYRRGFYWEAGKAQVGNMLYVPVPLGALALLPEPDLLGGPIVRDRSGFVLLRGQSGGDAGEGGRAAIAVFNRCRRWQVVLRDKVKAQNDAPLRLHIAVHTSLTAPSDDPALLAAFSTYKQYLDLVEEQAGKALQEIAQKFEYRKLIVRTGDLLDILNDNWQKFAAGPDIGFPPGLFDTRFTGLVVKPLQRLEEVRLEKTMADVADVETRSRDLERDFNTEWLRLKSELEQGLRNVVDAIEQLTGSTTIDRVFYSRVGEIMARDKPRRASFADLHKVQFGTTADLLSRPMSGETFQARAEDLYRTESEARWTPTVEKIVEGCDKLEAAIKGLVEFERKNIDEGRR